MKYKGIEIVRPEGKTRLSHSRFIERDYNVTYLDLLGDIPTYNPKNWTIGQRKVWNGEKGRYEMADVDEYVPGGESWFFKEKSRVFSALSRNYQICNGGIGQYYSNGYDRAHAPHNKDDCARYNRLAQLRFINEKLDDFAYEVLPAHDYAKYLKYLKINNMPSKGWRASSDIYKAFPEFRKDLGWYDRDNWNQVYYNCYDIFEEVLELYAQYVYKRFIAEYPWRAFAQSFYNEIEGIRANRRWKKENYDSFEGIRYWGMDEAMAQMFA